MVLRMGAQVSVAHGSGNNDVGGYDNHLSVSDAAGLGALDLEEIFALKFNEFTLLLAAVECQQMFGSPWVHMGVNSEKEPAHAAPACKGPAHAAHACRCKWLEGCRHATEA